MLGSPSTMGFITYLRCFLDKILWGLWDWRLDIHNSRCASCKKELSKRRIEINIDRPDFQYFSEFDKFLCLDCAIKFLIKYKRGLHE